jgi:hypothetical protein
MHGRRRLCLALPVLMLPLQVRAQLLREVHGAHDAWAEPGLALAWGVLRGRSETDTRVLIRIEADPQRHARVTARGRDPFSDSAAVLPTPEANPGVVTIDVPRSHFADHPRTELRFFAAGLSVPSLTVFYLGVPDTTPEHGSASALQQDLVARLARVRAALR